MELESELAEQLVQAAYKLDWAYHLREQDASNSALKTCDEVIVSAESFLAEAYNLRGILLEELGRDEEALHAYDRALLVKPGFAEATDNLVALERELGIEHSLVTISGFSQPAEAHLFRTKLESEGIWASVADEEIVTANWLYSNAVGGVKLQVKREDAQKAMTILGLKFIEDEDEQDEDDEDELGEDDSADEDTPVDDEAASAENANEDRPRCPECHSHEVHYDRWAKRGVFASQLLLGFPLPFWKRKWICENCGHEWRK